jgi:hypothetical protein
MYVDTNNKTEYFIYIVTILRRVRSKSQTSIHFSGYPFFVPRIMTKITNDIKGNYIIKKAIPKN